MQIKTRGQAADDGDRKYYTGRKCINGHDSPRYVSSGICCKCNVDNAQKYAKGISARQVAKLQSHFTYPLHPDDFAAAKAFCQALDLQRGRMPHEDKPTSLDGDVAASIAQTRAALIGRGRINDEIAEQHNASLPKPKAEEFKLELPEHLR